MGVVLAFVGQIYRILNVQFHVWFQQAIKNRFVRPLVGFAQLFHTEPMLFAEAPAAEENLHARCGLVRPAGVRV
jgi:hypothetical protein